MDYIEAHADSIMQFEGWYLNSRSWRNRNPGNLRGKPDDGDGYRVFGTLQEGWAALRVDLQAKYNGSHGLTDQSTLLDLMAIYAPVGDNNNPGDYAHFIVARMSKILGRTITVNTTLGEIKHGKVSST